TPRCRRVVFRRRLEQFVQNVEVVLVQLVEAAPAREGSGDLGVRQPAAVRELEEVATRGAGRVEAGAVERQHRGRWTARGGRRGRARYSLRDRGGRPPWYSTPDS